MNQTVYRSQIDGWLLTAVRTVSAVSVAVALLLLFLGLSASSLVALPLLALSVALPWWVLMTTAYTFTDCELVIRSGPFRWNIALRQITAIKPTTSSVSSPALSTDRLRIESSDGSSVMVSPENRRRFLEDMRARGVRA